MIEIKDTSQGFNFHLNNNLFTETKVSSDFGHYEVETNSYHISRKLAEYKLSDLEKAGINIIKLSDWWDWTSFKNRVFISEIISDKKHLSASFTLIPDLENWKYIYSFKEFQNVFFELLQKNKSKGKFHKYDREIDWFEIEFRIRDKKISVANIIKPFDDELRKIYDETVESLNLRAFSQSIVNRFIFPEALKTSCEQYLLYFAQFLRDLGINATSNLKEEAGKVLFSVTPIDDVEALDKIREALAVYLHLPSSPIVYDESFAAMRQKQQIENLQHSQRMIEMEFRLSQKVIESQDKIIVQKDTLIDQQREIIEKIKSKSIMIDSAENKEELEEIFEGVKVGKSKFLAEQIGLHLNPLTAIKTVGKKILGSGNENKSVLGLDEKD